MCAKPTLAIYGIHDISSGKYPQLIHDHSIALYKDSVLVKYLHLERLTRVKYDNKIHVYILELLRSENIVAEDIDIVFTDHFIGRSFINNEGNIRFEIGNRSKLSADLEQGNAYWIDKSLSAYCLNHELAHIYSCLPFFGNFKENSLLFQFDGGASKGNYAAWLYKNGQIKLIASGWKLKYLSTLFNANALVFSIINANKNNQHGAPGKFMGFASFGKPKKEILEWLKQNYFFEHIWSDKKSFFDALQKDFNIRLKHFDLYKEIIQDIAATIHEYFIDELLKFLTALKRKTNADILYYTGGSALNIVANTRIIKSGLFKEVFIPPCTNDAGLSIGAGAFLEQKKHGKIEVTTPYLNNWNLNKIKIGHTTDDIANCANALMQKQVVGICNGYGEAGPRALGNRSIIALANDKMLAKKVSMQHKGREWYRPLAPVILKKNLAYFSADLHPNELSKYMLIEFEVKAQRKSEIMGVVHINGTARFQTIENKNDNPFLYDLLSYMEQHFHIKALINTSFNGKGEPIVHTREEAVITAKKVNLDAIVLNGKFSNLN